MNNNTKEISLEAREVALKEIRTAEHNFDVGNWPGEYVQEYRDKEVAELRGMLIAISTGIRKEFSKGKLSGDTLSDFEHFYNHHQEVEKQLLAQQIALKKCREALSTCKISVEDGDYYRWFDENKVREALTTTKSN